MAKIDGTDDEAVEQKLTSLNCDDDIGSKKQAAERGEEMETVCGDKAISTEEEVGW